MSLFKKLRGTLETIFQLGKQGPQLKNSSGIVQIRNSDDTAFAKLQAAAPEGDNDAVTLKYFTTYKGSVKIADQADCSTALPDNTAARRYLVVTTPGNGAAIGDLLFDDGSGSGTMEIIVAAEGRTIAVTDALSGGQVTFDPDSFYIWDADTSAWIKIGDIGSVTGARRVVRYTINNAATQDSNNEIPANARILAASVEITTPYSAGGTITIGRASSAALLQDTGDNDPQAANAYESDQDTAWGGTAAAVRTTVGGSPAAGAGVVKVEYTVPNA